MNTISTQQSLLQARAEKVFLASGAMSRNCGFSEVDWMK